MVKCIISFIFLSVIFSMPPSSYSLIDEPNVIFIKEIKSPPQSHLRWSSTNLIASVPFLTNTNERNGSQYSYIDSHVNVYDVEDASLVKIFAEQNEIGALEWNSDGRYLATTDRSYHLTVWDINN